MAQLDLLAAAAHQITYPAVAVSSHRSLTCVTVCTPQQQRRGVDRCSLPARTAPQLEERKSSTDRLLSSRTCWIYSRMSTTAETTGAETTTLTTARQSSQLLQLLRLVLQGSVRELRRYLARGGDPNARVYQAQLDPTFYVSSEESTGPGAVVALSLLAMCCGKKWIEQASLLIDAGADPDSDAGDGTSPMCAASQAGDIPVMSLLHSKGAMINCEQHTPLMTTAYAGKLAAVKWLVQNGADVTAATLVPGIEGLMFPRSAMLSAAASGHLDVLRFLHAQGASFIAEAEGRRHTALHVAAVEGQKGCIRFILACGFAADTTGVYEQTTLHIAAQCGERAIAEQLLSAGADIEAGDAYPYTPLMHAAMCDRAEVVALLVARGAHIANGRAAQKAAQGGSIAALNALMTSPRWQAMSRRERLGAERLLLLYVANKATLNALRSLLLEITALTSEHDVVGCNALHSAAMHGKAAPLICALIKEGVDPTAKTDHDQTPAEAALEAGHTLQATLLNRAADDKRKRDLQQQQQQQQQHHQQEEQEHSQD